MANNSKNLERRIEYPADLTNSVVIDKEGVRLQYNVGIAKINFTKCFLGARFFDGGSQTAIHVVCFNLGKMIF